MALPGDIATIILTGTYLDMVGNPRAGTVAFTPNTPLLVDTGSETILGGIPVVVALNAAGKISVVLPCTSGLDPTGWVWGVTETMSGQQPRTYAIELPSTLGSTVDISTLTILAPPASPELYLLESQLGDPDGPAGLNGSGLLPVAQGGTNAGTSAGARASLGAAGLASPAFTGTPTAPTASLGTNTTQLATTAFVLANSTDTPQASFTTSGVVKQTVYNVIDYGATGNGTTNDTADIQAALNAAGAGGTVWVPYTSAGYLCGALTMPPGVRLLFDKNAKLTAPSSLAASWILAQPSVIHNGTAIIGGTFDATAATSTAITNIIHFGGTESCPGLEIRGNTLINAPVHGMQLGEYTPTSAMKWVTGNIVQEHGLSATGFGIYCDYIGNVLVDGNYVYTAGVDDSIELGHSGPAYLGGLTAHLRCVNNTVVGGQINYPFSHYAEIANNTVIGNSIQNDGNTANYVQIIGNKVFNAPVPGASFAGISQWGSYGQIIGNYVQVAQNNGIGGNPDYAVISGNRVETTYGAGATTVAAGSNGGEISQVASWSSPSAGVLDVASTTGWLPSGTFTVATSSTTATCTYTGVSGNTLTGVAYVSGSATGTVSTGGAAKESGAENGYGIYPGSGGNNFVITGNEVTGNFSYGIGLACNFSAINENVITTFNGFNATGAQYCSITNNSLNVQNIPMVGVPALDCTFANNGGLLGYTAVTSAYTALYADHIVEATSGTLTLTLPTAVGCVTKDYVLKNSGSGVVTVATTSAQTIDGASTYTLNQWNTLVAYSDGANWKILSAH